MKTKSELAIELTQYINAFPNDNAFAIDAFSRGLTLVEAKAEYFDRNAGKLQPQAATIGAEPFAQAPAIETGGINPYEEAKKISTKERISIIEALKKMRDTYMSNGGTSLEWVMSMSKFAPAPTR